MYISFRTVDKQDNGKTTNVSEKKIQFHSFASLSLQLAVEKKPPKKTEKLSTFKKGHNQVTLTLAKGTHLGMKIWFSTVQAPVAISGNKWVNQFEWMSWISLTSALPGWGPPLKPGPETSAPVGLQTPSSRSHTVLMGQRPGLRSACLCRPSQTSPASVYTEEIIIKLYGPCHDSYWILHSPWWNLMISFHDSLSGKFSHLLDSPQFVA